MAVFALQQSVSANQREAILMIADLADGNMPALHRVATCAIRSKLTTMNIRVTVRALRSNLFEDQIGMALRTGNLGVHAAQRIAGQIVIKFRIRADWFPACVGMAVLARNCNWAMRIGDFGLRTTNLRSRRVTTLLESCAQQKRE